MVVHEKYPNMPRSQRISDPYKVIVALQIIRYHLDSLLFWPKDLSDREISSIPVISGLEEARLIYTGVHHSLPPNDGLRLVMDTILLSDLHPLQ